MKKNKGYALLTAVLAVAIFGVLILKARAMWETEIQRDNEQELLFRARQYVTAIQMFRKKNPNLFPKTLDELFEKKCIRKRFLDPMTEEGKWNVVMRSGVPGKDKNALLIVPEDMLEAYSRKANIIGVCSSSREEGFMIYRKKKKYCEWAVYLGEKLEKEMPELKFVADGEGDEGERGRDEKGRGDEREERGRRDDGRERDRGKRERE